MTKNLNLVRIRLKCPTTIQELNHAKISNLSLKAGILPTTRNLIAVVMWNINLKNNKYHLLLIMLSLYRLHRLKSRIIKKIRTLLSEKAMKLIDKKGKTVVLQNIKKMKRILALPNRKGSLLSPIML